MVEKKLVHIFDFDGTLVDSMKQWAGKMYFVLDRHGISYPENIIKILTPLGDIGSAEYMIQELGLDLPLGEIIAEMDSFAVEEYANKIPAKQTVKDTLRHLKEQGISLNVLTASPHRMLDVCMERLGMRELFDNIWSCEDFSMTKSEVAIYHAVSDCLQTQVEDCIFFDDNFCALQTAKNAGMATVGVFDESSAEYETEIRKIVDKYIYCFAEYLA